jgi:hypothetical protein
VNAITRALTVVVLKNGLAATRALPPALKRMRCRATTCSPRPCAPNINAAGIAEERKGWLFRTARGHKADALSDRAMNQSDAWLMIRRLITPATRGRRDLA